MTCMQPPSPPTPPPPPGPLVLPHPLSFPGGLGGEGVGQPSPRGWQGTHLPWDGAGQVEGGAGYHNLTVATLAWPIECQPLSKGLRVMRG